MNRKSVGVYGIGSYLPEPVRTNDWWPEELVAGWRARDSGKIDRPPDFDGELSTEGARLVMQAMNALRDDPFRGARERRIMPDGMMTSEMEREAAKRAIERAAVDPQQIDLVLSTSSLPDHLMVPNPCRTHEALGLARRCLTLQTEGVCNAFNLQLALAEQMIAGGRARHALLIQSSGVSRFMLPKDPMSAWFGDGATAVVVGPVAESHGVLGVTHETHGELYEGLVCGVPDKRWYEGQPHAYIKRPDLSRRLLLDSLNQSRPIVHDALAQAGYGPLDVDFYAAHQGFAWFREVTQKLAGLDRARTVDTFPWLASMLGANIPMVLAVAERDGLLRDGDLVATFGGAAGAVLSSIVMRWGGRA